MSGVDLPLTVDANGAYGVAADERSLRALERRASSTSSSR